MWQDKLKEIIYILENSNVNEIEIKSWGHQYRVVKSAALASSARHNLEQPIVVGKPEFEKDSDLKNENIITASNSLDEELNKEKILSPMPGTFYAAPTPEDDNYVKVGDIVKKGQTVCIIEAMKIMNEIESDYDGVLTEIKIDNGNPVEYNQTLFIVSPT
ncbi:MAG: acetyl-CoA carboxylase, biotin carboxyl carrier protein [bacterium TMED264]|nr:MAG: acetyl-CoA carboxylase, biotin carboxyl carrier protein [bacterium TMED264]|tara:strand:+ start:1134 stop:1613 length:480 start_codon:yes stop_codon:yes gene_type:complete